MNFWRITCKDLLVLWRDRRSFVILLALPMVFITIIGLSTGRLLGWQNDNDQLSIAVVDAGEGPLAPAVIERLIQHDGLSVQACGDPAAARRLLADGRCNAIVLFGPAFQDRIEAIPVVDALRIDQGGLAGDLTELDVQVSTDPALSNVREIIEMVVQGEVLRVAIPRILQKNAFIRRYIAARTRQTDAASADTPESAGSRRRVPGRGGIVYQTIVPSYTVLFTYFLVTIMAGSFLAERSTGTLERLLTMPVGSGALLIGKTLPYLLISLAQAVLLFVSGHFLFGMSWGRAPHWLPAVILCTSLSATSLGLVIAAAVRTTGQITTFATLIIIVMAGISGCFMPRAWLPPAMQQISLVTPHAWALIAYHQLLTSDQPDLPQVARCCAALLGISGCYMAIGWLWFQRAR